jgi:hypothetical protein
MSTRVVNMIHEIHDIYIGRPGRGHSGLFGNPFRVGRDGSRDEVIEKFRTYFYERIGKDPVFKAEVLKLKGKRLGCFCSPLRCHGDIIVEYLERDEKAT